MINERLAAVQAVIYLIFNEGYTATAGASLVRNDLCKEAIRLGRVLCELLPNEPENRGLLALMLLQDSRRDARLDTVGEFVTLDEQDRSRWDRNEIAEGLRLVRSSLAASRAGTYQLQAAIAAVHAEAPTASETNWRRIATLYIQLKGINSSQVVALNYAVAVAMGEGIEAGLELIDQLSTDPKLDQYYLFHSARAELLRRLGRFAEATTAYERALSLTANEVERRYILRRLDQVKPKDVPAK